MDQDDCGDHELTYDYESNWSNGHPSPYFRGSSNNSY